MVSLGDRYRVIRQATEELSQPLSAEDCGVQSMADASPTKWHLAHTSWFFETFVLAAAEPAYRVFHPEFRSLFNSYYNAVGDRHARHDFSGRGSHRLQSLRHWFALSMGWYESY